MYSDCGVLFLLSQSVLFVMSVCELLLALYSLKQQNHRLFLELN